MTTTEQMNALTEAIEARKSDHARATVAYEAAQEAADKALARLKKEFKVSTPEEGEALLLKLQKRADKLYEKAKETLDG